MTTQPATPEHAPEAGPAATSGQPCIQLLHVPDCPLVDQVRTTLHDTLRTAGLSLPVEELEGSYPSPTVLVNGIDIAGRIPPAEASCRLDLPIPEQILDALVAWCS